MKHTFAFLFVLSVSLFFTGCKDKSVQLASDCYETALQAYESGDYVLALSLIDSIRVKYPTVIDVRRSALALQQKIDVAEQTRSIAFEDSLLAQARKTLESVLPKYKFEKDEEYQDMGNYVIPSQNAENNLSRSYIRAQVNEKGRLVLISTYAGKQFIHHKSIKIGDGNVFQESGLSDDCYEYKDLGVCYEKCNIHMNEDPDIVSFIAMNSDNDKLVLTFVGAERNVQVPITSADRKSIASLYELSQLLLFIDEHQRILDESKRRLQFVTSKMSLE